MSAGLCSQSSCAREQRPRPESAARSPTLGKRRRRAREESSAWAVGALRCFIGACLMLDERHVHSPTAQVQVASGLLAATPTPPRNTLSLRARWWRSSGSGTAAPSLPQAYSPPAQCAHSRPRSSSRSQRALHSRGCVVSPRHEEAVHASGSVGADRLCRKQAKRKVDSGRKYHIPQACSAIIKASRIGCWV